MPTKAEKPAVPAMHLHRTLHESSHWTDDLPVCDLSGVGVSTNQLYREDGQRVEEHPFEDRCFHFKVDDKYLYGLFDGHDGTRASNFAAQRIPAELLLGQLNGKTSDAEIRDTLEQAFVAVEKGFFQSIDDLLAVKANLQLELPEGLSDYQTCRQFPDVIEKLQALNTEIAGGTTAVVALVQNDRLYVANVGDSRAILCSIDANDSLVVQQLSIDHDIHNEDERLRLKNLRLDVEKILQGNKFGNQDNTRCIGNYMVKGGYKDFDILSSALSEPVIAEPYICGGIPIDSTRRFLLLMSDGLYRSLEEGTETTHANEDVARMVLEQFDVQSTLFGVAQAVVDRVVRMHHDKYVRDPRSHQRRDDISLLVRNFNQPFRRHASPSRFPHSTSSGTTVQPPSTLSTAGTETGSTMDTTDSSVPSSRAADWHSTSKALLDEEGLIEPYVDFADFYRALEEAQQNGSHPNNAETQES